ncbi:MAG TPA: PAS domain S-box protein, partial [Rubrobacteraceae bacterium]|nr:PAS domain S-box protein [Rubrobacteraceae bacterium]
MRFGEDSFGILGKISDAVFVLDVEWRFIYANPAAEQVLSGSREEILGKTVWEELPEFVGSTLYQEYRESIRERVTVEFEEYCPPLETWFEITASPLEEVGLLVYLRDIKERKRAEKELREYEERLGAVFVQYASDVITILEGDGTIRYQTPAAENVMGYKPEELIGTNMFDHVHPDDVEQSRSRFGKLLEQPGSYEPVEVRFRHADGSWRYFEGIGSNLLGDPKVRGIVVNSRDVTERKRAEEALRESEQRFRQLFEQSVDAIFVHDEKGRFVDCNSLACRLLGYSREELLSLSVRDISCNVLIEEDRARQEKEGGTLWQRAMSAEPGTFMESLEEMNRRKDGTTFPVEVRLGSVDYGGRKMMLVSTRDITERKALEDELAYRAFHDPLTGLPNRALFLDCLERALGRAQRREDLVAVMFLDLDDFKVVNDSLRHEVGDQLLVAVGQRLEGCLRAGAVAARLGGDEFTVLLEGISSVRDAEEVAERIIRELRMPFNIGGHLIFITVSIGIALSDAAGRESGDLLRAADIALYRAKDESKARYEVFDRLKDAHALERLELENDLRKAIERDELRLCYQPVLSLVSDYVAGMEALLRWEHPERGTMSPTEFIPLAEETGLIVPIGSWLLEKACRQAREWQEKYPSDPQLIIGVNLS